MQKRRQRELLLIQLVVLTLPTLFLLLNAVTFRLIPIIYDLFLLLCLLSQQWKSLGKALLGCYVTAAVTDSLDASDCS